MLHRKNRLRPLLALVAACSIAVVPGSPAIGNDTNREDVKACYIRHLGTGTVICEKNSDRQLPVASITKVVTVMTALDEITDVCHITVPIEAEEYPGHGIGIRGGEIYPCREFLRALLVGSGNDAARAAAIFLAGSDPAFADRMNRWCAKQGLGQSRFVDPHGFSAGNVSTARDLALLLDLAGKNRFIRESFKMKGYTLESRGGRTITIETTNMMLSGQSKEGMVLAGKTGFTLRAGYCFAGFLEIHGDEFLFIVLGADHQWKQFHRYMLECARFLKR